MQIGEVNIPHVLDDTIAQSRPSDAVPDPDGRPQVETFRTNLQQGNINFHLHVGNHPNSESIAEQRDGAASLPRTGAPYHPFEFITERGHLAVNTASVPRQPDPQTKGQLNIRYLPDSLYQPAVYPNPVVESNDFNVTSSGVVGVSDTVSEVMERDGDTVSFISSFGSVDVETGTIDLYSVSDKQYLFEYQSGDYADPIRDGAIRAFDHEGSSSESDWTRIYKDAFVPEGGIVIDNGFIRFIFDDPSDNNTHVYWYDGSSWVDAGTVGVGSSPHRLSKRTPDTGEVDLPDGVFSIERGGLVGKFDLSDLNGFTYDTGGGDNPITSSNVASSDVYVVGDNSNISFTYLLAYPRGDVTKNVSNDILELQNYSSGPVFVGVYPSSFDTEDTAHRAITNKNLRRELVNRRAL